MSRITGLLALLFLPVLAVSAQDPVMVVDGRSGEAVPGARVFWLAWPLANETLERAQRSEEDDLEVVMRELGTAGVADAEGRVTLPGDEDLFVFGQAEGLQGVALFEAGSKGRRLALQANVTVSVRVVDGAGDPVRGIGVSLEAQGGWPVAMEKTGEDGVARFRNPWRLGRPEGARAVLQVVGAGPAGPEVTEAAEGGDVLEVVMPETSRVRVLVVDPSGEPFEGEALVRAAPADSMGRFLPAFSLSVQAEKGVAVIPRVAPGTALEITVGSAQVHFQTGRGRVVAPEKPGTEAVCRVVFGHAMPILTGTLVHEGGEPAGGVSVLVQVYDPKDSFRTRSALRMLMAETEPDGRFRLAADGDLKRTDRVALKRTEKEDGAHGSWGTRGTTTIVDMALPWPESGAEHDLGTIVLPVRPLIASGIVTDAQGDPAPSAEVRVERRTRGRWSPELDLRRETDADGRFSVEGACGEGPLRLLVTAREHFLAAPLPIEHGADDLHVVLRAGGMIAGRLVVPDGVDPGTLEVFLEGSAVPDTDWMHGVDGDGVSLFVWDGRFSRSNLRSGTATVRVRAKGSKRDLRVVSRIKVVEGEICTDPRLDPIDLEGTVVSRTIKVRSAGGEPVELLQVYARAAGTNGRWERCQAHFSTDSRIPVVSEADAVDLIVVAKGYRIARLEEVRRDREVVLQPAPLIPVEVTLPDDVDIPKHPVYIVAELQWEHRLDQTGPDALYYLRPEGNLNDEATFDASRKVVLHASEPGVYRIQLWTKRRHSSGGGGLGLGHTPDRRLRLEEGSTGLRILVDPDREDIRAYIERWGK